MSATQFRQIVEMQAAFDKRDPDPTKNYGIHGVELQMILAGPLGAVSFTIFTNWQLPHVTKAADQKTCAMTSGPGFGQINETYLSVIYRPTPAYLGYHSARPLYEGHEASKDACPYLDDKPCYSSVHYAGGKPVFDALLRTGSDGVWKALEELYRNQFEKVEA